VRAYANSWRRALVLPSWVHHYNWHRPHARLHDRPPISLLASADNLVRLHT